MTVGDGATVGVSATGLGVATAVAVGIVRNALTTVGTGGAVFATMGGVLRAVGGGTRVIAP
jgi:hypothetical protein